MKYRVFTMEADVTRQPLERVKVEVRARDGLEALKKARKKLENDGYKVIRPRLPIKEKE